MEQFGLLRINFSTFKDGDFFQALDELSVTKYLLSATDRDAPGVTHCVSAVRYLIRSATGETLPLMYVGNMCRDILNMPGLNSRIIPLSEGEKGDLIFFRGRSRKFHRFPITHVGILISEDQYFHSAYGRGGSIDCIEKSRQDGSIATCRILSSYTDDRGSSGIL